MVFKHGFEDVDSLLVRARIDKKIFTDKWSEALKESANLRWLAEEATKKAEKAVRRAEFISSQHDKIHRYVVRLDTISMANYYQSKGLEYPVLLYEEEEEEEEEEEVPDDY